METSKKIRAVNKTKGMSGRPLLTHAPYGYIKSPDDKYKWLIDDEAAEVVRRIYEMAQSDMGSKKICKALNDDGIPTPVNHRKKLLYGIEPTPATWKAETIIAILRNRSYLGDTIQGTYDCARFKQTPSKHKPKDEWIITPGTHEPLVSVETWEYVQKMIDTRHRPLKSNIIQLFAGFVKCEDCGYALGYSFSQGIEQYTCGHYRRHGKNFCSCHYIRKDVLEKVVLDDIRKYSKLAKNEAEKLIRQIHEQNDDKDISNIKALTFELERLTARNTELDNILKRLYEDNISGKISDERFNKFLTDYEKEQSEVQTKISETAQQIKEIKANQRDADSWIKLIQNYTRIKKLDRTVLSELVDKITVGEAKEIAGKKITDVTIYYRFIGAVI